MAGVSATTIAVGFDHACAVVTGNGPGLLCWGWNGYGQLGIGNTVNRSPGEQCQVSLGSGPLAVSACLNMYATAAIVKDINRY
jgi:alpha-tubulin suppressor-like RCC1 family protein